MQDRVVLLKTGWMNDYGESDQEAAIRPKGGGRYNEDNIGHEVFNFLPDGGRYYGYAHIGSNEFGLTLRRIDPGAANTKELSGVTVIWVAPYQGNGDPVVVGWYRNATVLAARGTPAKGSPRRHNGFISHAAIEDCVLVPPESRYPDWRIPRRDEGGFGQSNVLYARDEAGEERPSAWLSDLLERMAKGLPAVPGGTGGSRAPRGRVRPARSGSMRVGATPARWTEHKVTAYEARTKERVAEITPEEKVFVNWAANYLTNQGADPTRPYPLDLRTSRPVAVIFEAKKDASHLLVREAVGQLYWYDFLLRDQPDSELCVLVPEAPTREVVEFVEDDRELLIAWREGDRLVGGPKTSPVLVALGVGPPLGST